MKIANPLPKQQMQNSIPGLCFKVLNITQNLHKDRLLKSVSIAVECKALSVTSLNPFLLRTTSNLLRSCSLETNRSLFELQIITGHSFS